MTVRAPFRFAPVCRDVYFPAWAPLVSHDVPFKDGVSGEVTIEIEATQPLLIGGARRKPVPDCAGEVWPFEVPGVGYAIPEATLRGMARSILEVAACGSLGKFVYDRRFGFRDLKSPTGEKFYQRRMATNVSGIVAQHAKAGWLIRGPKASPENPDPYIIRCLYARITFPELRALTRNRKPDQLDFRNEAPNRYEWFIGPSGNRTALNCKVYLDPEIAHPHARGRIKIEYRQAFATADPARILVDGTVVFTGKPQSGVKSGDKKQEFVFHTPDRAGATLSSAALVVAEDVWRDFDIIHSEQPGRKINPNWSFWKDEFDNGGPVPIFYLEDGGKVTTFGTAFMFKTALPLSTHDMLRHSSPDHTEEPEAGKRDLPSLIFGDVADDLGKKGLKRRASFDLARVTHRPSDELKIIRQAVLLEPKAGFFPAYVRQPGDRINGTLEDRTLPFATYSVDPGARERERTTPELAGVKLWPARDRLADRFHPPHLAGQHSIQTTLHALPIGTRFRTILRFHNLRPVELGAVFWALSFGNAEAWSLDEPVRLRHRLGMGKPYGLGEVAIRIVPGTLALRRNDGDMAAPGIAPWVSAFETEMGGFRWRNLPQIRTLMRTADPALGARMPQESLEYMVLNPQDKINEFGDAKTEGTFLPDYMIDEVVCVPGLGTRIRMTVGAPKEGVVVKLPIDPMHPRSQWGVLLDGETKPRTYTRNLFEFTG